MEHRFTPEAILYMCPRCVGDVYLRRFIRANAVAVECSFCGRRGTQGPIAGDAGEVLAYVQGCLETEWN